MKYVLALACAGSLLAQEALKPLEVQPRMGVFGQTGIKLSEVIQRVLANDRDIEVSRIERQEAGYNVTGALGAYDPRIGVNGHRNRVVSPVASILGGAANGKLTTTELQADPYVSGVLPWTNTTYKLDFNSARQTSDSQFLSLNPQFPSAATINITQPLWRGLRFDDNRYRVQVARRNRQLSDEQFRQSVTDVVTRAINAYWDLDFAYRDLDVQIQAVRLAEQQFESNRRQVDQGLLAPVDVIAAQTQVAIFRENVFAAQDALTRAENALKQLMLADRADLMWGVALIPETPIDTRIAPPVIAEAIQTALATRPEIAQSNIAIEVNKLDARLARDKALPQVDVVASAGMTGLAGRVVPAGPNPFTDAFVVLGQRLDQLSVLAGLPPTSLSFGSGGVPPILVGGYNQSLNNIWNGNFPEYSVGLQISIPVRNRTANAQSAVAAAEGRKLHAQRQQLEMSVEAEVRNSLQSVGSSQLRLEASGTARRSAEEQYTSEQRQFQAGTSTVFLVLQRQTDLINARTREVRAQADLGKAVAALDRATAHTIEAQNIKLATTAP